MTTVQALATSSAKANHVHKTRAGKDGRRWKAVRCIHVCPDGVRLPPHHSSGSFVRLGPPSTDASEPPFYTERGAPHVSIAIDLCAHRSVSSRSSFGSAPSTLPFPSQQSDRQTGIVRVQKGTQSDCSVPWAFSEGKRGMVGAVVTFSSMSTRSIQTSGRGTSIPTVLARAVHGGHWLCSCHVPITPTPLEPRGTSTCLSTIPFQRAFGTVVDRRLVPDPCTSLSWRRFDGNRSIRGHETMATRHVATSIEWEYILPGEGTRVATPSGFDRQRENTLQTSSRRRGTSKGNA